METLTNQQIISEIKENLDIGKLYDIKDLVDETEVQMSRDNIKKFSDEHLALVLEVLLSYVNPIYKEDIDSLMNYFNDLDFLPDEENRTQRHKKEISDIVFVGDEDNEIHLLDDIEDKFSLISKEKLDDIKYFVAENLNRKR